MTFLEETLKSLQMFNKEESDILWAGSRDGDLSLSWEDLKKIISEGGIDSQKVAEDLVIVGDSWWLERQSNGYDYRESWELVEFPTITSNSKPFKSVFGENSCSEWLSYYNQEEIRNTILSPRLI